jgi:hypothetical protein
MGPMPDLRGLVYFAIVGMVASAIAILGGTAWLIWFVINHVRII